MKLWLFDILACPIDKHYPLELYIFSFENKKEDFRSIIYTYETRDITIIKNENIIEIFKENNQIYIKDDIIIEKTEYKSYLKIILTNLNEFFNIFDKSRNEFSNRCFNIIKSEVKSRISDFLDNVNYTEIEKIIPELFFINKIKLYLEIQSGILFCTKCKRWYPIVETIPQMLPDKYRDEKSEVEFLKNNKNLLDAKFFDQDLKPFKI